MKPIAPECLVCADHNFTKFKRIGMKTTDEIIADNPNLKPYRMSLYEDKGDLDFQIIFNCYAEDDDHAAEQALDAYPNGEIIHTMVDPIRDPAFSDAAAAKNKERPRMG